MFKYYWDNLGNIRSVFGLSQFWVYRKGVAMKLSPRQMEILKFIVQFVEANDYPPSIREIGEGAEISSTSVVNYNLNKLASENLILRTREVSRGLSLNWERLEECGLAQELMVDEPVEQVSAVEAPRNRPALKPTDYFFYNVPLLGRIAAGIPINVNPADRENPEDWVEFRSSRFRQPEELFALRVQGDSMIDASVMDGDIVILRHQQTAENGEIVAAWVDDMEETTLKRIYALGDVVELRPCNPIYKSLYPRADQVTISGKLVSVLREYE
jgi:repressor LexA